MNLRCPHCRNPIEIVDAHALSELNCPSCGSAIRIGDDPASTATLDGSSSKRVAHFELQSAIGSGAFGTVWKALDTELDRAVAVKIPRTEDMPEVDRQRFLREARAAAQLSHPNIVPIYEVGRESGTLYIVSEFVDGVPLSSWLTAKHPTFRESADLCAKIALALQHAHDAGVIHRDLKPANILIDSAGEPHLLDFGLAKRHAGEITVTHDGAILGTPAYMSPEQAQGQSHVADGRSDVYSLGAILFELLTGDRPFRGDVRMLLHQVVHAEPPRARQRNRQVPRDLEIICDRCLQKSPDRRYPTARELAEDLRRWLNDEPIRARPISTVERWSRACRRNPVSTSLAATAVVALAVGTFVSGYYAWRANERTLSASIAQGTATQAVEEKDAALAEAQEAADRANRALYNGIMAAAQDAFNNSQIAALQTYLERARPEHFGGKDYRGFEWFYWDRLLHNHDWTFRLPMEPDLISFSRDGSKIAVIQRGKQDRPEKQSALFFDTRFKGEAIAIPSTQPLIGGCLTPSGRHLILAKFDGHIEIWDVGRREVVGRIERSPIRLDLYTGLREDFFLCADDDRIVVVQLDRDREAKPVRTTIELWDLQTGALTRRFSDEGLNVKCVTLSPHGDRFAAGCAPNLLKIWDTRTGEELRSLRAPEPVKAWDEVKCIAFSPSGKSIATATSQRIDVWHSESGDSLFSFQTRQSDRYFTCLAFSPDGRFLASGGTDCAATLWPVEGAIDVEKVVPGTADASRTPKARSPSQLWRDSVLRREQMEPDISFPSTIQYWGHTDLIESISFASAGRKLLAVSYEGEVRCWETALHPMGMAWRGRWNQLSFDSAHGRVALGQRNSESSPAAIVDIMTGQIRRQFLREDATNAVFAADGALLALGSYFNVDVFEPDKPDRKRSIPVDHFHPQMTFSRNGQSLLLHTDVFEQHLWNVSLVEIKLERTLLAFIAALSPDGKWLATSGDHRTEIHDTQTGERLHKILHPNCYGHLLMEFSPDGESLAFDNSGDSITIVDWHHRQAIISTVGHKDGPFALAWHPNGTRLATAGYDSARIWDSRTGQQLLDIAGAKGGPFCDIEFTLEPVIDLFAEIR